jgi:molybdopterin/thiamine biosynthesis adenylyltransferase/rhodanese-related sulfurtransferase
MNDSRYIRQTTLPQVGNEGQEKLQKARVLVVGAGGLGNALLPYLASSGIGTIGIVDGDTVALSNLHRQVLFCEADIGKLKVDVAVSYLKKRYKNLKIQAYPYFLSSQNASDLIATYDLVVDATDERGVRYVLDDYCFKLEKPWVHASIYRFQFQVATFNVNGSGTYRCLYPEKTGETPSCSDAGVMPSTVALAGLYQANEVFKYFIAIGELLTNKLLMVDTLNLKHNFFEYENQRNQAKRFTENTESAISRRSIEELAPSSLLLDVRSPEEEPHIVAENYLQIPVDQISEQLSLLKGREVGIFCQTGKRSIAALKILKENGIEQAFCLIEQAEEVKNYIENGKK